MHIDWRALLTHVLGFLIALAILRRYAWGPILGVIEERQNRIRRDLQEAADARKAIETMRQDLEGRLRQIEAESRQKIVEAVSEGQRVAAELKEYARADAQGIVAKAREEIQRETDKARVALRDEMVAIALTAAGKVIEKDLDEARDRELVRGFIGDLEKL